jgi:hypothetical protein
MANAAVLQTTFGKDMTPTGNFRISGIGITPQTFTALADARSALQSATDAQIAAEAYLFNVQARARVDGGYTGEFCNLALDTAPAADYYAALNYMTEKYEDRATYLEAKNQVLQLRNGRNAFLASSATIEEEWLDDASGMLSWIIYETLNDPKA